MYTFWKPKVYYIWLLHVTPGTANCKEDINSWTSTGVNKYLCLLQRKANISVSEESRMCHPKICCSGILITFSWRHLNNSRCKKGTLPPLFFLKAGDAISTWTIFHVPGRSILITRNKELRLRETCTGRPCKNNCYLPLVSPCILLPFPQLPLFVQPTI